LLQVARELDEADILRVARDELHATARDMDDTVVQSLQQNLHDFAAEVDSISDVVASFPHVPSQASNACHLAGSSTDGLHVVDGTGSTNEIAVASPCTPEELLLANALP
jgi:hypothetical protein